MGQSEVGAQGREVNLRPRLGSHYRSGRVDSWRSRDNARLELCRFGLMVTAACLVGEGGENVRQSSIAVIQQYSLGCANDRLKVTHRFGAVPRVV